MLADDLVRALPIGTTDGVKSKMVVTFARLIIEILIIDLPPDLALNERA